MENKQVPRREEKLWSEIKNYQVATNNARILGVLDELIINEKTGKEQHTRSRYACWASTVDDATKFFNKFAESCLADICVVSVKRSKYDDII